MNWIWVNEKDKNTFAEFERAFHYMGGSAKLRISADFKYAAYINGEMASCGQYADLPDYKSVNERDITSFLKEGENVLTVIAWHMGKDCPFVEQWRPQLLLKYLSTAQ